MAGKTATLSFWAKADSNKNIAVEFIQVFGTGGSPSSPIYGIEVTTFSLTTAWQKFTVTVDIPSVSGKTLGDDGNDCLQFNFWLDAGSDYNSRTNSLGHQSGTFDIAQVQLEEGSVATDFEQRHAQQEFALCERYFEIAAGRTRSFSDTGTIRPFGQWIAYSTAKRTTPIVTLTNKTYYHTEAEAIESVTAKGFTLTVYINTVGNAYLIATFRADAEL